MKNVLKIIGVLVLAFIGYVAYMVLNPLSPKETINYSSDISYIEEKNYFLSKNKQKHYF